MADVLVTGATGLLGSKTVDLLAQRHRVSAIARAPRTTPTTPADVRWIEHDLCLPSLPADLPPRVDVVIHLAQGRNFRDFPGAALETYSVNVTSTALLLNWACAAGARQFVLASTGGVYPAGPVPHREDEVVPLHAVASFYAATKLAAEAVAGSYAAHLVVTTLRPFFVYGRGQETGMLIPRLAESVRLDREITLDGEDGMRFNPVHVTDAARAVVATLSLEESCVLNVAGPEVVSLRQVVDLLASRLGTEPRYRTRADMSPTDFVGDISRMAARLHEPQTVLADVVEEICG